LVTQEGGVISWVGARERGRGRGERRIGSESIKISGDIPRLLFLFTLRNSGLDEVKLAAAAEFGSVGFG